MVFSSSHVWMWELDYKESWALKNQCFWTVVLEKTLENPLDSKEIQSVLNMFWKDWCWSWNSNTLAHLMWITDSLAKTLMLGKSEGRRRKGRQRMRWLDGITDSTDEFEQAPGVGDGQECLVCCSPWDHKESKMTEWLNWTELCGKHL